MRLTFEVPVIALLPGGDQISNNSGQINHATAPTLSAPLSVRGVMSVLLRHASTGQSKIAGKRAVVGHDRLRGSYAALRPCGVTAPLLLRLKAAGMTERFPFGSSTGPTI